MFFRLSKILLLFILFSVVSENTSAQFWKKSQKAKGNTSKSTSKEKATSTKKEEFSFPKTEKKEKYRMDILLPIDLDALAPNSVLVRKGRQSESIQPYINFYEGVKLASEFLSNENVHLDIYIHDEKNNKLDIEKIKSDKELDKSDLLIGLVHSRTIPTLANFAKENRINFISAFSPSDAGVQSNPYFHVIQPTLNTHVAYIANYVKQEYVKNPKFIFYRNEPREKEMHDLIKSNFKADKDLLNFDISYASLSVEALKIIFSATETNIVFVPILHPKEAEKVINAINVLPDNYKFEIFGLPSWNAMAGLKNKQFGSNISIYLSTPFYYDQQTAIGKKIATDYKAKYGGTPSEMVFRGYETIVWYAYLLKEYGTIFNEHLEDVSRAPFTTYKVKPTLNDKNVIDYYENRFLYLEKYNKGEMSIIGL